MNGFYQLGLARSLKHKMTKALDEAGTTLVTPGALGHGVTVTHANDAEHVYDPIRGVLTVTGVVRIEVHGLPNSA